MRRKFAELEGSLEEFAYQDESPVLLLRCDDAEAAYALKAIDALDQRSTSDLFFAFAEPFLDAERWVARSAAALRALFLVMRHRRAEEGGAPLPALPDECDDARAPPRERLLATVHFLRGLLPDEDEHRLVLALLPARVDDPVAWAALMASVLPPAADTPWARAVRFVAREHAARPLLTEALRARGAEHALSLRVDLSTAAVSDALTRDAADPAVPVGERMAAMLQLAMLDFAYKRHREALRKFGALHDYYAEHGALAMQALCLQGAGDVLRAEGRGPDALTRYQQGVAVAMRARALPVLLNLLNAAGEASLALGRRADARQYFNGAADTAGALLNPFARCDALERAGDASDGEAALDAWRRCERLAAECRHAPRLEAARAKLAGGPGAAHADEAHAHGGAR